MSFVQFDHGSIVRTSTGRDEPRMIRLVIGNPLIMQEMAKGVPDTGSYAPVTVLVDVDVRCCGLGWHRFLVDRRQQQPVCDRPNGLPGALFIGLLCFVTRAELLP
jgi:hypothetical protein